MLFIVCSTLLLLCTSSAYAQNATPPSISPTPAPAPEYEYVNLTDLVTVASPFQPLLGYLQSTKVIETFQNQANNSKVGVTMFVPTYSAFLSLKAFYIQSHSRPAQVTLALPWLAPLLQLSWLQEPDLNESCTYLISPKFLYSSFLWRDLWKFLLISSLL